MARALLALLAALVLGAAAAAETIAVRTAFVPFDSEDRDATRTGALVWKGGLALTSDDPRFGGLSGLHVELAADGARLTAVSDRGYWFTARLVHDRDGRLAGLADAALAPMRGPDGGDVAEGPWSDAEALARMGDRFLVGFERRARIWSYAVADGIAGRPAAFPTPPGLGRAPSNEGLEALAALPDGRLFALTEGLVQADGTLAGWVGGPAGWAALSYVRTGTYKPTDAAALPSGDVLVLERRFSWLGGPGARLARVRGGAIRPGAALESETLAEIVPPMTVDNMEGIGVVRGAAGETRLYLVSDDNYSALQRTLLMLFVLDETRAP
ncbi:MAG: twin-arginine translocation pathway signal [Alphaproteobacteria bacterium]|nr:twin-arginine translocation pathway signal [Alphaproteobacteria bacterium]